MNLKDAIYTRKSCRDFIKKDLEQNDRLQLQYYIDHEIKPLFPNIKTKILIEERKNVKCIFPWATNQLITVYSEEKEGFGLNVGFMLQHIDLYLHTIGLSSCWLGLSKSSHKMDGLSYVICIAVGYAKKDDPRHDISQFKRKDWQNFSDKMDEKLEGARIAPSSRNSQPWYFTHEGDTIRLWYVPQNGAFRSIKLSPNLWNEVDLGIAIAHMCICNDGIKLFKEKNVHYQNYMYVISFKLN